MHAEATTVLNGLLENTCAGRTPFEVMILGMAGNGDAEPIWYTNIAIPSDVDGFHTCGSRIGLGCCIEDRRVPGALPLYKVSWLKPQVCPHLGKSPK